MLAETTGARRSSRSSKPVQTEFFRVDIGGGIALDGWCMLPPNLTPTAKYPLLVHVYGEPAGQTVLDRWGGGATCGTGCWPRAATSS